MMENIISFQKNILINGKININTGLHIGGPEGQLEIGVVDNRIIIDPRTKLPIIPGSSLKGKMRSLLELENQKYSPNGLPHNHDKAAPCKDTKCNICRIFGTSADLEIGPTRLLVRDAFLTDPAEDIDDIVEVKTENVINRLQGKAESPRSQERVSAGTSFDLNMVFSVFEESDIDLLKDVFTGMRMLEDSYLGGSGSRGYGKIAFDDIQFRVRSNTDYKTGSEGKIFEFLDRTTFSIQEILENFNEFKNQVS
ncbi:MAG: type III-A CRISPR-associated RAMP protein Csm3 [Candidatus Hodarchaeota archaeon]